MASVALLLVLIGTACESPFSLPAPVKNITIAPDSAALETGDLLPLSATVTDSANRPVSTPVYWSSSIDSVATVSQTGVVAARLPGNVTISASAGGLIAAIPIRIAPRITAVVVDQGDLIVPVGGTVAFTASTLDAQGDHLVGRPVTWSTQNASASSASRHRASPSPVREVGSTRLIASHGALSDSVSVTVGTFITSPSLRPVRPTTRADSSRTRPRRALLGRERPGAARCPVAVAERHPPRLAPQTGVRHGDGRRDVQACGHDGSSGMAYCWGSSARGRLGAGVNQLSTSKPVMVADSMVLMSVTSGWNHTCGPQGRGRRSAGGESPGAGGAGAITWNPRTVGEGPALASITASVGFGCGLSGDGGAYCWGTNGTGQLGNGSTDVTTVPTAVAGGLLFTQLAAGWTHACGLVATGAVECWGNGEQGQLGANDTTSHFTPGPVSGDLAFVTIAAGGYRTCGLTADGSGYCWGDGVPAPAAIPGTVKFTSLTVGNAHACGLGTDGRAYCWGRNYRGQLGDGTSAGPDPCPPPRSDQP